MIQICLDEKHKLIGICISYLKIQQPPHAIFQYSSERDKLLKEG